MTGEQMERAIEFLLDQHARFSAEMVELREIQRQHAVSLAEQAALGAKLTSNVDRLTASVADLTADVDKLKQTVDGAVVEMREAIDNLIIANEVMRGFGREYRETGDRHKQARQGVGRKVTNVSCH
jgi:outer membrane murein-binding lipoprotein Lpp